MPSGVLLKQVLPLNAVRLGRFVLSVEHPHQDFLDPIYDHEPESVVSNQADYSTIKDSYVEKSFSSSVARLVSASRSKHQKSTTRIEADEARTYMMMNCQQWFDDAVQLERSRKWIERAVSEGSDIYLVIGYITMTNARVIEGDAAAQNTILQAEDPITAALTAPTSNGDMNRPATVSGRTADTQLAQDRFLTPGEQIYAVQYRKLRFGWFSSRDLAKGVLEKKNTWNVYWGVRDFPVDEEGPVQENVLEVTLTEDLELEDSYEKHNLGLDGNLYI